MAKFIGNPDFKHGTKLKIGILLSILLKRQSDVKIEDGDKTSEDNIENREAS